MKRRNLNKILFSGLILILVLVFIGSGLLLLESTVFYASEDQSFVQTKKTITRDGVRYFPRQDITVLMILGVDQEGKVQASTEANKGNAVDMVTVVVADEQAQTYSILNINRDTMLDMPVLDEYGKEAGTVYAQLSYSHIYGTGVEDSCENTRKTVSNFLYGIPIDYYIAMNMEAVPILNDAVGGVTVNVTEDFSDVDETITQGEMTLKGQQAIHYVQVRKDVGDQKNISRMERQKTYMKGFVEAFKQANQEESFVLDTYESVSDYIVTNFTTKSISNTMNQYKDYALGEVITPEGENKLDGEHYEFYADEQALDALILRLLYAPKNS